MTKVKFYKIDRNFVGVTIKGHSDYGEAGNDIVCAAISTSARMLLNGITYQSMVNQDDIKYDSSEEQAWQSITIKDHLANMITNALYGAFYYTMKELERDFNQYVEVTMYGK